MICFEFLNLDKQCSENNFQEHQQKNYSAEENEKDPNAIGNEVHLTTEVDRTQGRNKIRAHDMEGWRTW